MSTASRPAGSVPREKYRQDLLAGFTIPDLRDPKRRQPEPVYFTRLHICITGMTGESGKSTLAEGLLSRMPGKKILTLVTKRGEEILTSGMTPYRSLWPYLVEKHDWQYVLSLVESSQQTRLRDMEAEIIDVCQSAQSLTDVYNNTAEALDILKTKKRDNFKTAVLTRLKAYLDIVMDELRDFKFTTKLDLKEGFSVMDISQFSTEMQQMIVESIARKMMRDMNNVVLYIPEAAKIVPRGRSSPAKVALEEVVQEGRSVGNLLCLDTQAFTQLHTPLLKQMGNVFVGKQQEANEVVKALKNITDRDTFKPTPEMIQSLQLGQFYAIIRGKTYKIFGMPAWMNGNQSAAMDCAARPERVHEIKSLLGIRRLGLKKPNENKPPLTEKEVEEKLKLQEPPEVPKVHNQPHKDPVLTEEQKEALKPKETPEQKQAKEEEERQLTSSEDNEGLVLTAKPVKVEVRQTKHLTVEVQQVKETVFTEDSAEGQILLKLKEGKICAKGQMATGPSIAKRLRAEGVYETYNLKDQDIQAAILTLARPPYHVFLPFRNPNNKALYFKPNEQVARDITENMEIVEQPEEPATY